MKFLAKNLKKINDGIFIVAFAILIFLFLQTLFNLQLLSLFGKFPIAELLITYLTYLVIFIGILSLLSLFKVKLFFNSIPYNYFIIYVGILFVYLIIGIQSMY